MTPEQIKDIADAELCGLLDDYTSHGVFDFARAIEARVLEELRKQEPLTETQIREMWERTFSTNNPFCPCDLRSFTKAVRATEGAIQTAKPIPPRIKDLSELRDELDAAPIPPDEPKLKRASLMAFGVISEIRKLVGNGKVQFVADLGGSIWTWPDAADSAITELRSVCFDTAPIPPDNHDWKAEYLRQVDLHNQTLDELREAEMQLRNPAPTPPTPTPSQEEALDAKRWRYYADCPQTALMLGTELDPNSEQDWAAECSRLVDASLARPDTEGSKP